MKHLKLDHFPLILDPVGRDTGRCCRCPNPGRVVVQNVAGVRKTLCKPCLGRFLRVRR